MKVFYLLSGVLLITHLVVAKPTKSYEDHLSDDDIQNDYDPEDYNDENTDDTDDDDALPLVAPEIISKSLHLRGNPGDTVFLPCTATHSENYVILWKKNGNLIFQDAISAGPQESRYSIFKNRTIKITGLEPTDTADFECSIVYESGSDIKVTHRLEINTPPSIVTIRPSGTSHVLLGSVLELHCEAAGIPEPKISWSKSGTRLQNKHGNYEGSTIIIESVQKDNAGLYQCLADNGIGSPATDAVDIIVEYAPTIKFEKMTINSAEGYESRITCIVHGIPKPTVTWRKNGERLESDKNLNLYNDNSNHILHIHNTKKSDFGNYTCEAENKIGFSKKEIHLTGKPGLAELKDVTISPTGQEAHLVFQVESNSPIIEYELKYRIKGKGEQWHVELPRVNTDEKNLYTVDHTIKDLEPEIYEVKLRSRNSYGWSHFSHHKTLDAQQRIEEEPMPVSENQEEPQKVTSSASRATSFVLYVAAISLYMFFV